MNTPSATAKAADSSSGSTKNRKANYMHQATIVAALRRLCGMTQDDLASEVGVSRRTIASLEANPDHVLDPSTADSLSAAFLRRGIYFIDRGDVVTITIPKAAIAAPTKGKG